MIKISWIIKIGFSLSRTELNVRLTSEFSEERAGHPFGPLLNPPILYTILSNGVKTRIAASKDNKVPTFTVILIKFFATKTELQEITRVSVALKHVSTIFKFK